jgi:hypothetical protein
MVSIARSSLTAACPAGTGRRWPSAALCAQYVPKFEWPEISQSQRGQTRHALVAQRVGPSIAAVIAQLAACLGRGERSWDTRA